MTLRHLKIFVLVCECGSMTEAASRLYISQPSVSQAIRELESHYGIRVFERIGKRLVMTETGGQLLGYARHILSLMSEMEKAISNVSVLKIGATLTVGEVVMPSLIAEFQNCFSATEVQVLIKNTDELLKAIEEGNLDLALIEGKVETQAMISIPIVEDEVICVCGRNHPLYLKSVEDFRIIDDMAFISREKGSGTRAQVEEAFAALGIMPRFTWECNSFDSIRSATLKGLGIAAISRDMIQAELDSKSLWEIRIPALKLNRFFSLVYHKNKYMTDEMRGIIKLIEARG